MKGQPLLGTPIFIQPTMAEKNRYACRAYRLITEDLFLHFNRLAAEKNKPVAALPTRLNINNISLHVTEDQLNSLCNPFGKVFRLCHSFGMMA